VPDPEPDPDHVERQAIFAAQQGDNQPFARLLRTHDPALRTVATFLVGPASVDEVLHDAYLKAFRSIPRYEGEPMPQLWLTRPVVSVALDHLRKRHRTRPRRPANVLTPAPPPPATVPGASDTNHGPDPETGVRIIRGADGAGAATPTPGTTADGAGTGATPIALDDDTARLVERLRSGLDTLLLEDRVALTLVDVAGLSISDAATTIQVEAPTITSRLDRARASVQRTHGETTETEDTATWSPVPVPPADDLAAWFDLQPVPAHHEDFWTKVGAQLLEAKYRPAAPGPDPGRTGSVKTKRGPGDGAAPTPGPGTVQVSSGAEHAVLEGLAARSRLARPASTGQLRRVLTALVAVAAVAAVVIAAFVIAGKVTHHDTQLGTTPAKVVDRVNDALAGNQTISGTVAVDGGGNPVVADTYLFARNVDGSYQVTASGNRWVEAYDATAGRFVTSGNIGDGGRVALVQTGVAPGPPDPTATSFAQLGDPLTGVVRLLRQGHNTKLTNLGDNGVPQYVLDTDLTPGGSGTPSGYGSFAGVGAFATTGAADHLRVVIDQSLQLPVEVQLTRDRGVVMHLRFSNLSLGQPAGDTFRPAAARGSQTISRGYQVVPLNAVSGVVGYTPPAPAYLPGGFTLASAAALAQDPAGASSTAGNRNPPDQGVVVLAYRHGGDTIVVTVRRFTSQAGRLWLDPFASSGDGSGSAVTLTGGRFLVVGATASDKPVAHIWGHDRDLVFTVAGDVSSAQLAKVASSLQ